MAQRTKEQLKSTFVDGHVVTGSNFTDLIDSLKPMQMAVSSPTASGSATAFIDSIQQDANGKITVTKKNVSEDTFVTWSGLDNYQANDKQRVDVLSLNGTGQAQTVYVRHGMAHFPTVRLIDSQGVEVPHIKKDSGGENYHVQHLNEHELNIVVNGALNGGAIYRYVLD